MTSGSRLVSACRELIHGKGFTRTTVSDIAEASGVLLGNLY
ncbi:MAG: TetR family transcriptional regulator [Burkholderiales bacterium]|nr:TetR family transcriptional regulator [Burkholderiales bacterium]